MSKGRNSVLKFAVCIRSGDSDLLTPRKIYQVLPDTSAAKLKYVRVVDDEGEDYLYPAEYFMSLELPQEIERALSHAV